MIIGTPFYMSPEQIRGKTLDGRSDQFSLAVVAYEILAGRKPFQAEQLTSICYQIIHEEPLSVADIHPELGPDVAAVISRGLSKDADSRYGSCTEFAAELAAAVDEACQCRPPEEAETKTDVLVPVVSPPERRAGKRLPSSVVWGALLAGTIALTLTSSVVPDPPERGVVIPPAVLSGQQSAFEQPQTSVTEPEPPPVMVRQSRAATRIAEPAAEVKAAPPAVEVETKVIPPAPAIPPDEPLIRKGTLVWTGQAAQGDVLTISGTHASMGSLAGGLPGHRVTIEAYPASLTADGLTVFTPHPRFVNAVTTSTPRGRATYTFDPRHATDLSVFEVPSAHNDWRRLVLRVNKPITAFVIEWQQ
jgi:hypothetical protein